MIVHKGQLGITDDVPQHGRYLTFRVKSDVAGDLTNLRAEIKQAAEIVVENHGVMAFGAAILQLLKGTISHSLVFPNFQSVGISIPVTSDDIWIFVRGQDPGEVFHTSQQVIASLGQSCDLTSTLDGFKFKEGRDLTGYVDGTENPEGDDAISAAFTESGESYVAVQKWQHDLVHFESLAQQERDHIIGRRLADNHELDDAPLSAHVKRTAQESFEPQAFILRRSMPYSEGTHAGLNFVCFAHSPTPFKQQLARMVGKEDGVVDGLFRFSRPLTGGFFWCPAMKGGQLDLSNLSIY